MSFPCFQQARAEVRDVTWIGVKTEVKSV